MPNLHTPAGRLTPYGLYCGYVERAGDRDAGLSTELYHQGGVFHVRQFDRRPNAPVLRTLWESFRSFRDARRLFDSVSQA